MYFHDDDRVLRKFRLFLLVLFVGAVQTAYAQGEPSMEQVTPGMFASRGTDDEVGERTVVTFRYGPRKESTTKSYFGVAGANNFTWYRRVERVARIYLDERILADSLELKVPSSHQVVSMTALLYSLAGDRVVKTKLHRKYFHKFERPEEVRYKISLASAFKNGLLEVRYETEEPYMGQQFFWKANTLARYGRSRLEFEAPEFYDFRYNMVHVNEGGLFQKEETKGGFMSFDVFGDETGKSTIRRANINYQINKVVFVTTPETVNRSDQGIIARVTNWKHVPVR